MTPEEVAQYIAEYPRKDFLPGDQAVVLGGGAVPHRVPAQNQGYVWELVESVCIDEIGGVGWIQAIHGKLLRWDALYQYHEDTMAKCPLNDMQCEKAFLRVIESNAILTKKVKELESAVEYLAATNKRLRFMVDNGLGEEDMR